MAKSTRKAADTKNDAINGKANGTSKKHLNGHAIGDVRDGLFEDKAIEENFEELTLSKSRKRSPKSLRPMIQYGCT